MIVISKGLSGVPRRPGEHFVSAEAEHCALCEPLNKAGAVSPPEGWPPEHHRSTLLQVCLRSGSHLRLSWLNSPKNNNKGGFD